MSSEKRNKFYVSLYVSIPFILAGLAVLFVILTFRMTEYFISHGESMTWPIVIIAGMAALVLFGFGLLTVWMLFHPVQSFVKRAQELPVLAKKESFGAEEEEGDELNKAVRVFHQVAEALSKVDSKQMFPEIIGESQAIRSVFNQIKKVAPTDSTVLILGESGTGKELVATSIYEHSKRYNRPFVKINCVAIPAELLESELFGHEKGAFTGAVARKIGKFEAANGGTIFLDEIGDMPLELQAKMLRVLQEKEFERVGGNTTIKVDVRFIAATNKDLVKMIREGKFRDDLYYRINVFSLLLPPLRERSDDIIPLINYFLAKFDEKIEISREALRKLINHDWPGNVRDLQNTIERAAVLAEGGTILAEHLPSVGDGSGKNRGERRAASIDGQNIVKGKNLDEKIRNLEKKLIMDALLETKGVQVRAAELLGIKERSLWNRIKKHEIDVEHIKNSN